MQQPVPTWVIDSRRAARWLAQVTAIMFLIGLGAGLVRVRLGTTLRNFVYRIDLANDASLQTWFASATLGLCAVLAVVLGVLERRDGSSSRAAGWFGLGALFTAFSLDEVAMFHEWSTNLVTFDTGDLLSYSWVAIGLIVLAALAVGLGPFVYRLPTPLRRRLVIAAAVYFGGALGLETLNGHIEDERSSSSVAYVLGTAAEEAAEMAAVVLAFYALLDALAARAPRMRLALSSTPPDVGRVPDRSNEAIS